MESWDFNAGSTNSKKKEYTSFPQGITLIRLIDLAPHIRWAHWEKPLKRYVNCPGHDCPICKIRKAEKANKIDYTHSMSKRFAMNVINYTTGKLEIMEQGVGFFEDIKELKDKLEKQGHSLSDAIISVKRKGTEQNTNYRIDIEEVRLMNDADKALIADKHDLDEVFAVHTPEQINQLLSGIPWNVVMGYEITDTQSDDTAQGTKTEQFELK